LQESDSIIKRLGKKEKEKEEKEESVNNNNQTENERQLPYRFSSATTRACSSIQSE